ncbi:hypothetical protein RJ639_015620 [Escallonia herrerae]|uniref:Uncharacterized protein n=1 Tax=Escallonia herrerae TaxID=1293975 RepID=A0AA88VB49_9ASTE|nr:hypothetical protein RJ639_015620 [Escallonia herrerae]
MKEGTSINDHLKVILDLQNIDIKIEDDDQALLLLHSFPLSYEHLVNTLLYWKGIISLEEVEAVIISQLLKDFWAEANTAAYLINRSPSTDLKYGYVDMVAYAVSVAKGIKVEEPITYKEAIKSTKSVQWIVLDEIPL